MLSTAIDLGLPLEYLDRLSVVDVGEFASYRNRRTEWAEVQRKKKTKTGERIDVGALVRKGGGDL